MLVALRVQNFILIEALELRLEPGCNVLTGETGAGKSIVVGALGLLLGGRARTDMVRPGATEAVVEALFDVTGKADLVSRLDEAGIHCDGELVIRRVVQANGRSRAYLNGRLCSLGELSSLVGELADITSQHESVALADPGRHLEYLDRFGKLTDLRHKVAVKVAALMAVVGEIGELEARERGRAEREAFLRYQLDAIAELAPEPGELDELGAERNRLRHADRLGEMTRRAACRLDASDDALCDALGRVAADLDAAAELDGELTPTAEALQACWAQLRDLSRDVTRYAERVEADPKRLDVVQDRIFRLEGLVRQHGPTLEDVLEARRRIEGELEELRSVQSRLPALAARRDELLAEAGKAAKRLSNRRHKAARSFGAAISLQLGELGMGKARVLVEVTPATTGGSSAGAPSDGAPAEKATVLRVGQAALGPNGIDRVQFLIAPNRGMVPRPLKRIASGGELSRALLALKQALGAGAEHDPDQTTASATCTPRAAGVQVFDEVDAGIGGSTADKIGRAIAGISVHRQVLCITHLASIAAHGEAHFVIEKRDEGRCVHSELLRVEGKARVAEIARMLTGDHATAASSRAARELLAGAVDGAADRADAPLAAAE
ncbi:MAG: DNA repair protein RecN [Deltaproteobacteria bacterium]|nr:DNA repair protein RecN [Deltaproteobacteria bacterium]